MGKTGALKAMGSEAGRVRISDEELVCELRRFAAVWRAGGGRVEGVRSNARGGPGRFGVREFSAWPERRVHANTIIRRFGSWRAALARIGTEGVRERNYDAAELLAEFERVWEVLGRKPGETTLPRIGRFSLNAYKRRWGSVGVLGALVERARAGEIGRDRIVHEANARSRGGSGARRRRSGGGRRHVRRTVGLDVRWKVLKRDRYRCVACGRNPAADGSVSLEVDHIVPVCRGGGNEEANLRTLCRECNAGKGGRGELGTGNG